MFWDGGGLMRPNDQERDPIQGPDPARYPRQHVLPEIGFEGQERLGRSVVALVGCGGLGTAQADLLSRAGVGRLILIDPDVVSLPDLHRQCLYVADDAARSVPKVQAAAARIRAIDPRIVTVPIQVGLDSDNASKLLAGADLIMDATDNFAARYRINDAAVQVRKPWVYGGIVGTCGNVMPVLPEVGPCLRCIAPEPPDDRALPNGRTHGVLNAAVSWVAALQVAQALRILVRTPADPPLLHEIDVWRGTLRTIAVRRAEACPCCGLRRFEFLAG